ADATIEAAVGAAAAVVSEGPWGDRGPIVFAVDKFAALPAEVALRLLGRAIAHAGDEGPVELGKLETLHTQINDALHAAGGRAARLRRTLAGALVTVASGRLLIERAPPRSSKRGASAPNPKFARIMPRARSRTSGSKGH